MKAKVKSLAEQAFSRSGVLELTRYRTRGRLRILMYHRFRGSPSDTEQRMRAQCAHLCRNYAPVSMGEVARAIEQGTPLPDRALAITVDDGYGDFRFAFPVFREFGLKVTIFAVTGFVDRELWLWPDRVQYLFRHSPRASVEMLGQRFDLGDDAARQQAECAVDDALVRMPDRGRRELLEALPGLLGVALPDPIPEGYAALSWDELRQMARSGLEVGAHTRTHPILSRLETREALRDEIAGSKARLEEQLQSPILHFCYPNGTRADYDSSAVEEVRRAGYQTSVTAELGFAAAREDRFQLHRIHVDPALPPARFERAVAGFRLK